MTSPSKKAQKAFDALAEMGCEISFHPSAITPRPDTPQANLSLAVGRSLEAMQDRRDAEHG